MKSIALILIALSTVTPVVAQTKARTESKPAAKSRALIKAEEDLKMVTEQRDQIAEAMKAVLVERDENMAARKNLESVNGSLAEKLNAAMTMLRFSDKEMKVGARDVTLTDDDKKALSPVFGSEITDLGKSIEKSQNDYVDIEHKLTSDNDSMVQKYNSLLADYKDYVQRVGIQLAQIGAANRLSNALAVYNAMPRYSPPPIQIYQPPVQINCTSNTVGTFVYTNCN